MCVYMEVVDSFEQHPQQYYLPFFKIYFYFIYVFICVSVCAGLGAGGGQKREPDPLELLLQVFVSHPKDAGNPTPALCSNSKCS